MHVCKWRDNVDEITEIRIERRVPATWSSDVDSSSFAANCTAELDLKTHSFLISVANAHVLHFESDNPTLRSVQDKVY
jgi:hypothetical protein